MINEYSYRTSQSGNYSNRTNAGDVVCEFVDRPVGDWRAKDSVNLTIAPYMDEVLQSRTKIMMESLSEKAAVLNDIIERIGSHLVEVYGLQEPTHNRLKSLVSLLMI